MFELTYRISPINISKSTYLSELALSSKTCLNILIHTHVSSYLVASVDLSQRHGWGLRYSGIWRCVLGLVFPHVIPSCPRAKKHNKNFLDCCLNVEVEGIKLPRNVGNHSFNGTALHPLRLKASSYLVAIKFSVCYISKSDFNECVAQELGVLNIWTLLITCNVFHQITRIEWGKTRARPVW